MPLRMIFHREDLERIRIRNQPDPFWELVLSMIRIRDRSTAFRHARWHRETRQRIARAERAKESLGLLCTLIPERGTFPNFLTPAHAVDDVTEGCAALIRTPRQSLRSDLRATFAGRPVPPWVRELANGDRKELGTVVRAVRRAHEMLIKPYWSTVEESVAAEHAERVGLLAGGGVRTLLSSLPGVLRWDGQVLEVDYPTTRTVDLRGRGLTLIPTYFCVNRPVTFIDPELPPALVFRTAAAGYPGVQPIPETVAEQLTPVLGRTRAECLRWLDVPRSTSGLAECLGTSIGTASKQATALRKAGLVVSTRQGGTVLHRLTPLGMRLLTGEIAPATPR